jgi:hypothetical protein
MPHFHVMSWDSFARQKMPDEDGAYLNRCMASTPCHPILASYSRHGSSRKSTVISFCIEAMISFYTNNCGNGRDGLHLLQVYFNLRGGDFLPVEKFKSRLGLEKKLFFPLVLVCNFVLDAPTTVVIDCKNDSFCASFNGSKPNRDIVREGCTGEGLIAVLPRQKSLSDLVIREVRNINTTKGTARGRMEKLQLT